MLGQGGQGTALMALAAHCGSKFDHAEVMLATAARIALHALVPVTCTDPLGCVMCRYCIRGCVLQGEKSERMLQLTADMINSNSADYTAWQHRWDTLTALKLDLQKECVFTE